MEIILELEVTIDQVKTKKILFWVILQIYDQSFNP